MFSFRINVHNHCYRSFVLPGEPDFLEFITMIRPLINDDDDNDGY